MSETREVEVTTSVSRKQLVTVTFPIYLEQGESGESGEWTTLTRINADLTWVSITRRQRWRSRAADWQVDFGVRTSLSSDDVGLTSNHVDAGTRRAFDEMVSELRHVVLTLGLDEE